MAEQFQSYRGKGDAYKALAKYTSPKEDTTARDNAEDKKRRAEAAKRLADENIKNGKNADGTSKGALDSVIAGLGAVGNFVKDDMIVGGAKAFAKGIQTAGEGAGHIFDDVSGATAARDEAFKKRQDEQQKQLLDSVRKRNDQSLDQAARDKAAKLAESITAEMNQENMQRQAELGSKIEQTDTKKQVGATLELATTIAGLGAGSALKSAGKAAIRKGAKTAARELTEKELKQQVLNKAFEAGSKSTLKEAGKAAAFEGTMGAGNTVGATLVDDPNASAEDLIKNGAIGAAAGGVLGGIGGALVNRSAVKGAKKVFATDAEEKAALRAADDIKLKAQADAEAKLAEPGQKLLEEPGRAFHKQELDDITTRLDRINNGDQAYLEENGLIKTANDDGRLRKTMMENPERAKAHEEAGLKAVEAEDQVKYYNEIKASSPYHRQLDRLEEAKTQELAQIRAIADDGQVPESTVAQLTAEVEKSYAPKYDALAMKYPQDAAEAPAMEQALMQATNDKLDAHLELQRLADEDMKTIKEAGGMLKSPDTEKLTAHKQQLEARHAEIEKSIAEAEARKNTPITSTKDVDARIDALQNGDKLEFRKADGSLDTRAVKKEFTRLHEEKAAYKAVDAEKKIDNPEVKDTDLTPEDKDIFIEEAQATLGMKKHQSATQLFQTPRRFLRKMGLNALADKTEEGFSGYRRGLATSQRQLQDLADETGLASLKNKASKERVSDALNGKENVPLTASERKAVEKLQSFFSDYADRLGLPKEGRIADYFPHMYQDGYNSSVMSKLKAQLNDPKLKQWQKDKVQTRIDQMNEKKNTPIELQEIINKKFSAKTKAGNIDNARLSDDDAFIKDPIKVALAYAKQAERRLHLQPVFEEMKKTLDNGDLDEKTADYITNYGKYLKGDQAQVDKWIDSVSMGVGTKAMGATRNAAYRANLQMNLGTALRNLTQATNTMAEIGPVATTNGALKTVKMLKDMAKGDMRMMNELNDMGVLDDVFHNDGDIKVVGKFMKKFDSVGWAMFQATEKLNRGSAYFGAKAQYMKKYPRATEEMAKQHAADVVGKTQFHFNELDTPPLLRSTTAKTALQYQSFNIKQGEYLVDMFGGSAKELKAALKSGKVSPKDLENTIKAMRWVGANIAVTAALGHVMGVKFEEMIPNPLDQRNYGSPAVQLLFGDGKGGQGLFQVATGATDSMNKPMDENGEEITDPIKLRMNNAASFLQKTLPAVAIPWGTQYKKTTEGIQTVDKGYSETDSGNIRFSVDNNSGNMAQAALFGQYATPEAKAHYETGAFMGFGGDAPKKNLSGDASDKVKSAPLEARDEYMAFYESAAQITGRTKANTEVSNLFAEGQPEKARRKAAEFNAKVDEKMAKYYQQYDDMDDDLVEELNSKLYITLTPRGEKQRAGQ
jgi:hypothetical protein